MAKWVCLLAIVAYANAGVIKKRSLADAFVGAISNFGSAVLPETSMRNGCAAVGLYNREKDGSPPRRDASGGVSGMVGSGLAQFGDAIFSKSGMEEGCINAGFYDPTLDENGQPQDQGQFGLGQGGFLNQGQGGQGGFFNQGQGGQGGFLNQGQGGQAGFFNQGQGGQGGQPQQQQTTKKVYKCYRNGVQVECDPATVAQARGK